jgi:hypothetical protein
MRSTINRIFITSIFLFATYLGAFAQTDITKSPTLLWRISGNGLKKDSYIELVTTNVCAATVPLNKKLLGALANVQTVLAETGLNDPANENEMQKLVLIKSQSESVKSVLSTKLYSRLASQAALVGMNEVKLNSYKPVFITGLTTSVVYPCDIKNIKSTEILIRTYAGDHGLKVGELLSLNDVFAIFSLYPNNYWEQTIDQLINNTVQTTSDFDSKGDFFIHENLRGVCAIINKSPFLNLRYTFKEIESKRMNLLSTKLQAAMANQSTLFLLDIANVANSSTSIINMLSKDGYTISAILQ